MTEDLSLYLYDGCPFCERVRSAVRDLDLEIEERNILRDAQHARDLVEARGRRTVPVLRISKDGGDEWMPESADIVHYLYERYGQGKSPPRRRVPWWTVSMWGLWLTGAALAEPARSVLWTAALSLAAARSFGNAWRGGAWHHWAIGGAFGLGAVAVALSALGVATLPWEMIAVAVAAAALIGVAVQSRLRPA